MLPFVVVVIGIAAFTAMDVAMKDAAIRVGVFSAFVSRNLIGSALMLPVWLSGRPQWPSRPVLWLHALRAAIVALMAPLYFYGLVLLPMAEAIALSFIAPLIALYLAALFLGERVRPGALAASLLGLAGVAVIAAAGIGGAAGGPAQSPAGIAAILAGAVLYAANLVVQRRQAQAAGSVEVALFQNVMVTLLLIPFIPWLWHTPARHAFGAIAVGAMLASVALVLLSWGYARAETQHLLPIEYTAFFWSALLGWLWFGEAVAPATVIGAVLIVAGCLVAARGAARGQHMPATPTP